MKRNLLALLLLSAVDAFKNPLVMPENVIKLGETRPHLNLEDASVPTVEAGFVMSLTQKFFNDYN